MNVKNFVQRTGVFSLCLLFGIESLANPRLDQVQSTYHQGVDKFISQQLEKMLSSFSRVVEELGKKSFEELSFQAASIEAGLVSGLETNQSIKDFNAFLSEEHKLLEALTIIHDSGRASQLELNRLKNSLKQLNQDDICNSNAKTILLQLLPQYSFNEEIDLSHIPRPKHYAVNAAVGSEIGAADTIEKAAYLPATTGGCAAGQAVLWFLPVVGCLIGAAVGGAVAYGAGKASTAIITGTENRKENDAYNEAVLAERRRQQAEIDQARIWISEHPISDETILARAKAHCMAQPFSLPEKVLSQAEDWSNTPTEAVHALRKKAEQLSSQRDTFRTKSLNAMKEENLKHVVSEMAKLRPAQEVGNFHNMPIRKALATCLVHEHSSCAGLESCVDEAQTEMDSLGDSDAAFAAEIEQLRQQISICRNEEETLK